MRPLILLVAAVVGCGGPDKPATEGAEGGEGYGGGDGGTDSGSAGGGSVEDADRDGHTSDVDCDDANDDIHPDATEICDGIDNNCDEQIDEGVSQTWYRDNDLDGYGNPDSAVTGCDQPVGTVMDNTDCNDADATALPGGEEICDGVDNDCDGEIDGINALDQSEWFPDGDGDGFAADDAEPVLACDAPDGYVGSDRLHDCDDESVERSPGNSEICDFIDNDCDLEIDEEAAEAEIWFKDTDGDGYGDAESVVTACIMPVGYVDNSDDCNDFASLVHPGGVEYCNGDDDDCNGTIDDGFDFVTYYRDADDDGHGYGLDAIVHCTPVAGYVTSSDDCDDDEFWANPDVAELCGDDIDNDCDGEIDEDFESYPFYLDGDSDGYGRDSEPVYDCAPPTGYVLTNTDCDDANAAVNPGEIEACNGLDDNCDLEIDEGLPEYVWYLDTDLDGYGIPDETTYACGEPIGYAPFDTDCDDSEGSVYPGAYEMCDEMDNDCNDIVDDDCGSSRILGAYATLTCDGSTASHREVADYIDVSYNSHGTWNDSTRMGFRIGDGEGVYHEACYYGSPWQQVTIEYSQGGATYSHTGNFSGTSWSWTNDCSDVVTESDTAGVIHGWSVASIYVTKTEIWEDDGRVSRVWFDVDNLGTEAVSNLRVMFGVDPDHDYDPAGSYVTSNDTRPDGDYAESVGPSSRWTIGFGACDIDNDDLGHTAWSTDADAAFVDDESGSGDRTMHWRHTESAISASGSASFGFLVTVGQTPEEAEEVYDYNQPILCSGG